MKQEKSCGCIIIDNGKVLLVKSVKGHWGFPKGHMEEGETEVQTAVREVKEETNIDVEVNEKYRYVRHYDIDGDPNRKKEVVYFLAEVKSNEVINKEGEIEIADWYEIKDALKIITHDNLRNLFKKVLEEINEEW